MNTNGQDNPTEIRKPSTEPRIINETSQHGSPHERVRLAVATLFECDEPWIQEAAMDIALAAHPWPDEPVTSNVLEAIAAEMLPARNLQHQDLLELAIDRLLRIAEALQHEDQMTIATRFFTAAQCLQDIAIKNNDEGGQQLTEHQVAALDSLLVNPLGTTISVASSPLPAETETIELPPEPSNDLNPLDPNRLQETFALFQGTAIAVGSPDLGVIHGGNPTGITIDHFATALGIKSPLDEFDEYIDSLSSRDRDILISRTLTLKNPDTLEEVANRWKVTRERIRQKEIPLKKQMKNVFTNVFSQLGNPLLGKFTESIVRIDSLHAATLSLTARQKWAMAAAAFILDVLGPWKNVNGWAVHPSIKDRFEGLRRKLENAANSYNMLPDENAAHILAGYFENTNDEESFLVHTLRLSRIGDTWITKNTQQAQVIAALQYLGHPATKDEIANLLDITPASVGSTFGVIENIVRFDRYRWAFKDWTDDPYDGIVGEIMQRIKEYGGMVPVNILFEELPRLFQVTKSSVKAYLATDAFVVEDDIVRLASTEDYKPKPPDSCLGAIQVNGNWGQQIRLCDRHFLGHSLGLSFDIAYANGLRPDDDLLVPIVGHESQASLIWRSFSTNRRIDVGRVSNFLKSSGFAVDDEIVVLPTPNSVEILGEKDFPDGLPSINTSETEQNSRENGSEPGDMPANQDLNDPLLDLLGDGT